MFLVDPEDVVRVRARARRARAGRRTAVYADVYRRTRELTVALPGALGIACLSLYRHGRDFSRRERARLELVRAPLATAVRLLSERDPKIGA
jgi:hypothetical protein